MSAYFTRGPAPTRRLALVLSMATITLAACGGSEPDETYSMWDSSANGVQIKDWDNESYAVRKDNEVVARYSDDLQLAGLTIPAADLLRNGVPIGRVVYTTAVNGNQITKFVCLNGLNLDIVVSGSTWTYRCI
jgi:hypothetical protein